MKTLQILIILLALTLGIFASQQREFFFVAKEDRLGSISINAKNEKGIYLRWDSIGSSFPKDIETFELWREDSSGDKLLLSAPAQKSMSSSSITKIFAQAAAQRDFFRIIEKISTTNTSECSNANITNIGEKLFDCLESDEYWGILQSRSNFHVAVVRNRAFVDTTYDKTLSSISYKLIGKDLMDSKSIILGKVDVKLGQVQLALKALAFEQTRESQCNDNRYGLDDFRVALSWRDGGNNSSESFVNSITSSGYDLYYSTQSYSSTDSSTEAWAVGVDIRSLAEGSSHDANGEVSLLAHKLKKASSITLRESPYYEMQKDLKSRGFKPGEIRYYFLVSKDYTGNYGKTAYTKVVIPDLLPPPAPSNIFIAQEDISTSLIDVKYEASLSFDTVNFTSYAASHKDMKVCSTDLVSLNARVHFVKKDESCDEENGYVVNFNVSEYFIYRFDNSAEAASFEDLDLDGYNDSDESEAQKCNISSYPAGAKKYLIQKIVQTHEKRISFSDSNVLRGKQYWYRVVSVTPSGVSSHMSAPIPAYIPKYETLSKPDMTVTYKHLEILQQKKHVINQLLAKDSVGVSDRVRFEFSEGSFEMPLSGGVANISTQLKEKLFIRRPIGSVKVTFLKDVDVVMSQYIDVNRLFIFTTIYEKTVTPPPVEPGGFQLPTSPSEAAEIEGYKISTIPIYIELYENIETLTSGDSVVGGCVNLEFDELFINKYKGKACYKLSLKIGNRRYFLEKDCVLKTTKEICNETLNNEMVSVGVSFITDSGTQTPELYVNYVPVSLEAKIPNQPLLEDALFDTVSGVASIKVQALIQRVSGVILEFYRQESNETYTEIVDLLNLTNKEQAVDANVSGLLIKEGDTWCVRGKTIGLDNLLSVWSEPICHDIKSSSEILESLSWPNITNRVRRVVRDLNASFDPLLKSVTVRLAKEDIAGTSSIISKVSQKDYSSLIAEDYVLSNVQKLEIQMLQEGRTKLDRTLLQTITVNKFFNKFSLPKGVVNADKADKTNLLIITMKDKDGGTLGNKIEIKKEGVMKYDYSVSKTTPLTTAFITINSSLTNRACILMPLLDRYTNYVVYRQEVGENPSVSDGNFVQVSPLIERSVCTKDGYKFSNNLISYTFNHTERIVKYVDRYPYEIGKRYRYMFLFFDVNGEPQSYSLSNPDSVETY